MSRSALSRPALPRRSQAPLACLALLAAALPPARAQSPAAPAAAATPVAAATVVITGNPLGRDEALQPSSVLAGEALALRRAGTLGDTLSGLPGVAATGFGPQSSRPVIRGLDGDRVRLLDNGGASADASSLSFDHAVAIDPLVVERIEVLRGPAALLYGGNATGGVVNVFDNRIPREPITGLGGRVEWRAGGAAHERAGAALLEGGAGGLSWHADVAARRSRDLRVPRFTPVAEGEAQAPTDRVVNSAGRSEAGAVGLSWSDARGYIGAAVDSYRNDYGVTVEPDVTIRMRRDLVQLAGERRGLAGPFEQIEFRVGHTRYRHDEVEGSGEIGTTFRSRADALRVQARQAPVVLGWGEWHGVSGLQAEQLDFSALGEEAFVPGTDTRSRALFTLQELRLPGGATVSAGLRWERTQIHSQGDAAGTEPDEARFGPAAERRFSPRNASLAGHWPLAGGWSATASLGRTERAPAYYELYANGLHVATGAYERGAPSLTVERSRQLDAGLQWRSGPHLVKFSAYQARFRNYIALDATGESTAAEAHHGGHDDEVHADEDRDRVPVYAFRAVPARLQGFELEGRTRLIDRPWTLDLNASLDQVRGRQLGNGEPLPRLAPWRASLGLVAAQGAWRAGTQLRHAATQKRVSAGDVPTPGWTLVDFWAGWTGRWADGEAQLTLKLDNAFDRLATQATALRTARELAPLGGRALSLALRLAW
jgi:iron complex outermembrane receptor protein